MSEFGRALGQEPTSSDNDTVMSTLHSPFLRLQVSDIIIQHPASENINIDSTSQELPRGMLHY
jgi:hypothetical protein